MGGILRGAARATGRMMKARAGVFKGPPPRREEGEGR
jgi:hypothetical protein